MTTHELKIWPEFFEIDLTVKPFEIRKNDRNYKTGDILVLKEWNQDKEAYTGRTKTVFVTCVFSLIGLQFGWVCMGIKKL